MTREERIMEQAINLTEEIGAITAELLETIEAIHYDPENVSSTGIQQLRRIKAQVEKANNTAGLIDLEV